MPSTFATLKQGSTGAAVRDLQQDLTVLKYYTGAVDGVFGAKTKDAVVKFQQQNSVKVDGVVGYETEAAIERLVWVSKRPILKQGATGQEVRNLQALLKEALEIAHSDLSLTNIDGIFGANTRAAVISFQKSSLLTADGVVGAATWKELSLIKTYDMSPEQIVLNGIFTNV
ncbi:MAG: peptidoglycan-binding protein [Calothrix sp. FI2-JRJ7]|jgi:peptidoglycan hydrolase-like protein with peptidoglycan-binding domain|nr:peptidoglycan-binding protein [Calothrix sp. FI2-JRJ7]